MIFKTFPELSKAYSLKELYRNMNKDCSYDEAINVYDDMLKAFKTSGIRQFKEFTEILINWREEILNSYLRPYDDRKLSNSFTENVNGKLSNSFTENVNGKLRTYLAVSRGISNFTRFRKRVIYSLSRDVQYALNDSLHRYSVPKRKRGTYKNDMYPESWTHVMN